ncbi:hypothetical protein ACWT_2298 [Actinoplanes sp. SE50]|uniref:CG0192-related protein n=1 Tax=unclassified Actinoplanes TaxID=2626549 RepID=UPI00023ED1F4|nr:MULTISPECIES: hypothetical protein [unclassified Actinoplanes]AEV83320.1 hypothetical protein ACPL_2425 [Actinoplanes sp. SE50/110]ATO81713.1 hypothetical protein ACWT_2298 [Actinoplanes sp. SE50]SLL99121.1 uncharacterized protein ACSP50_2352 [Actinoplanes sp. SE50/110]
MALLHKAEIRPTKLELLSGWLPTRPWFSGPANPEVTRVAAARFDDPAGEVGLEVMLVRVGDGPVLHVPLTYRGAPLAGAEAIGTTEHSVLGTRWVYDACHDPVFVSVLGEVIRSGGTQAAEEVHDGERVVVREPGLLLRGAGSAAPAPGDPVKVAEGEVVRIETTGGGIELFRTPWAAPLPGDAVLTGMWAGRPEPVVLARLTEGD